ncbi:hypothetical protein P5W99_23415 [Paraburkholderia sp. A3BS-1L]|uniref:hypothetical protein n=1 Tax=Paraburkholderia sp. A3BS-1L TaxID=3028375 RepID=UPI003DA93345
MMESAAASGRAAPARLLHVAAWYGLLGVPFVWMGHVLVCMSLVATACVGGVTQHNALPWSIVHGLLALASFAAFVLALAGVIGARRARRSALALRGPQRNTLHFVAWCGEAVSIAFTIGLVFTISVLVALPLQHLCESWR